MRDAEIRSALSDWIIAGSHKSPTGLVHEFRIPRPSGRVDVAVINGEVVGYEIKSDADTLKRLPRQIRCFNALFDRVNLVTTDTHVDQASVVVPRWWGIVVVKPDRKPRTIRRAQKNPVRKTDSLIHALSAHELQCVIKTVGGKTSRRDRRDEIVNTALGLKDHPRFRSSCRSVLRQRHGVIEIHPTQLRHLIQESADIEAGDRCEG